MWEGGRKREWMEKPMMNVYRPSDLMMHAATCIGRVLPIRLFLWTRKLFHQMLWASMARTFGKVGKNCYIEPPYCISGASCISLGDNFLARSRFRIEAISRYEDVHFTPSIQFGDNVSFNNDCHVGAIGSLRIGNNVLFASRVFISDHSHGCGSPAELAIPPERRRLFSKGPVEIQDNVWVGEGVAILPGVTIGRSAIIGANSVVTRSIPAHSIAAGSPARVIRKIA